MAELDQDNPSDPGALWQMNDLECELAVEDWPFLQIRIIPTMTKYENQKGYPRGVPEAPLSTREVWDFGLHAKVQSHLV